VCPRPGGAPSAPDTLSNSFGAFFQRSGMRRFRFHDFIPKRRICYALASTER